MQLVALVDLHNVGKEVIGHGFFKLRTDDALHQLDQTPGGYHGLFVNYNAYKSLEVNAHTAPWKTTWSVALKSRFQSQTHSTYELLMKFEARSLRNETFSRIMYTRVESHRPHTSRNLPISAPFPSYSFSTNTGSESTGVSRLPFSHSRRALFHHLR